MKKLIAHLIVLAAVCVMLASLLGYSQALAGDVDDVQQEDNYCTPGAFDIETAPADESVISSTAAMDEETEASACIFCTSNAQCSGSCDMRKLCCIPNSRR